MIGLGACSQSLGTSSVLSAFGTSGLPDGLGRSAAPVIKGRGSCGASVGTSSIMSPLGTSRSLDGLGRSAIFTIKGRAGQAYSTGLASHALTVGRGGLPDSIGRDGSKVSSKLTVVGWEQMSVYNPYTSAGATTEGPLKGYWQAYFYSDGATKTISVALDKEAIGGETVTWTSDGDAIEGIHWTTTSAKTVTLEAGQKSFDILITPKESGKWYRERTTKLRLSATNLKVHDERGFVHLVFNSSVLPPVLTLSGPSSASTATTPITLTVTASYPPQDPIILHFEIDPSSALTKYTVYANGIVVIPASTTVAEGTFVINKVAGTTETGNLVLALVYERGDTAFVEQDYDTDLSIFSVPRNVHLDQNLWHQSNDIALLRFDATASDPIRPLTPGHPCSHSGGGAESINTLEGEAMGIDQAATPKLLDPITGNELKIFHPNTNVTSGMTYLREGFEVSYTGGPVTAHEIQPYSMTRWYFKEMVGVDADRNSEFVRVQVRHRNNDRNHGIVFRFGNKINSDWDGTDPTPLQDGWLKRSDGSLAVVAGRGGYDHSFTFSSGLKCWEYAKWNGHENSNNGWGDFYGAGEDSHGTYLWFKHFTDKNQSYATLANETPLSGQPAHGGDSGTVSDSGWWYISSGKNYPDPDFPDVPIYREYSTTDTLPTWVGAQGVSSGNPIQYPIWVSADDGSAHVKTDLEYNGGDVVGSTNYFTNRLNFIRSRGIGRLVHSMQFTLSVTDPETPGRFWPCEKSDWDPRGLAVIAATGTAHKHTINITR